MRSPAPVAATAVLIPVKSFDLAKSRLGDALSASQRGDLARAMTARVLAAAGPLPRFVVCGTREVAGWAVATRANVIWFTQPGLNPAIQHGVGRLHQDGFGRVIIAHGDLPLATDLTWLARADRDEVIIVPDRHGAGTNVASVPTGTGFRFAYGEGSAAAHRAEAARLGLRFTTVDDPRLGWDIDSPSDLAALDSLAPSTPASMNEPHFSKMEND